MAGPAPLRAYHLTCVAALPSLTALRGLVDAACANQSNAEKEACYDLKLALDEACTNVIVHGYAGMEPGPIELDIAAWPDRVEMTITDRGRAFEPSRATRPDVRATLDDRIGGGLGLHFIARTMDEVRYSSDAGGNHLTLVRRLRPGSGRGGASSDGIETNLGGNV